MASETLSATIEATTNRLRLRSGSERARDARGALRLALARLDALRTPSIGFELESAVGKRIREVRCRAACGRTRTLRRRSGKPAPPACPRVRLGRSPNGATGMSMHLFLDTNIYLGFFRLSTDDLEELRKLAVAVRSHDTVLYLTDQVCDEFRRNRARTINDALKAVEDKKLSKSFPRLLTNLVGFPEMKETLEKLESQQAALVETAREAALRGDLRADHLICDLFEAARRIPLSTEIRAAAETRRLLGNPPGKKDSIGDEINWESLLATIPSGEDLVLVSNDGDYSSKLDPRVADEFLSDEWTRVKRAAVSLQPSLTAAFKTYYPTIHLDADVDRGLAIDALIASPDFRGTHLAIQGLSAFSGFTPHEVASMVEAGLSNSQIRHIFEDDDVRAFYADLIDRYGEHIESARLDALREALAASTPSQ